MREGRTKAVGLIVDSKVGRYERKTKVRMASKVKGYERGTKAVTLDSKMKSYEWRKDKRKGGGQKFQGHFKSHFWVTNIRIIHTEPYQANKAKVCNEMWVVSITVVYQSQLCINHSCVFQNVYVPLAFDLDLVSEYDVHASSVLMSAKQPIAYWRFTFYRL